MEKERKISIEFMVQLFILAASLGVGWMSMDSRMTAIEVTMEQVVQVQRDRKEFVEAVIQMRGEISQINKSLEVIAEDLLEQKQRQRGTN